MPYCKIHHESYGVYCLKCANTGSGDQNAFRGHFTVINGKLDFVCITAHTSFEVVKAGLLKLRAEIDRQLAEEKNCPFHPTKSTLPLTISASAILQKHLTALYHGFNITMLGPHEERVRRFILGLQRDLEAISPFAEKDSDMWHPQDFSGRNAPQSTEDREGNNQIHIILADGVTARVSPNASPQLIEALTKMAELAKDAFPSPQTEERGEVQKDFSIWDAWEAFEKANEEKNPMCIDLRPEATNGKNIWVFKRASAEWGAKWMRDTLEKELQELRDHKNDLRKDRNLYMRKWEDERTRTDTFQSQLSEAQHDRDLYKEWNQKAEKTVAALTDQLATVTQERDALKSKLEIATKAGWEGKKL